MTSQVCMRNQVKAKVNRVLIYSGHYWTAQRAHGAAEQWTTEVAQNLCTIYDYVIEPTCMRPRN